MRRLLIVLSALLIPALASPQDIQKLAWVSYAKDLTDTAAYSYCKLVGSNGDPYAMGNPGRGTIETSGSSTTVVESVSGSNPFTELVVGDVIQVVLNGDVTRRYITARASAASITVDSNIDLGTAGVSWTWYQQKCGTGSTAGWIPVPLFMTVQFGVNWATKNATSLDYSVECRAGGDYPFVYEQLSITVAPLAKAITVTDGVWDECRIGMKLTTDTGAQSINAFIAYKSASK